MNYSAMLLIFVYLCARNFMFLLFTLLSCHAIPLYVPCTPRATLFVRFENYEEISVAIITDFSFETTFSLTLLFTEQGHSLGRNRREPARFRVDGEIKRGANTGEGAWKPLVRKGESFDSLSHRRARQEPRNGEYARTRPRIYTYIHACASRKNPACARSHTRARKAFYLRPSRKTYHIFKPPHPLPSPRPPVPWTHARGARIEEHERVFFTDEEKERERERPLSITIYSDS